MKATSEELKIGHGYREEDGTPLEPEAQPVDRVLSTPIGVTVGHGPGQGTPIDASLRGNVTIESTAGEMAAEFTERCHLCKHWDQQTFQRARPNYPPAYQDRQRAIVLELAGPEALDLVLRQRADSILDAAFGRCQALSHYSPDGVLDTFAQAFCPSVSPDGYPIPRAFTPRREAERDRTTIRDKILLTASGKEG